MTYAITVEDGALKVYHPWVLEGDENHTRPFMGLFADQDYHRNPLAGRRYALVRTDLPANEERDTVKLWVIAANARGQGLDDLLADMKRGGEESLFIVSGVKRAPENVLLHTTEF